MTLFKSFYSAAAALAITATGALADPAMILSHALASICGLTGQILIPEWLPPPMSNAVRDGSLSLPATGINGCINRDG